MTVSVARLDTASDEVVEALARLVPQLSSSAAPVTPEVVATVLGSPANTVLIALSDDRVVGALMLVVFPLLTGVRAWIEDVVVDESARGLGVGRALIDEALRVARERGASTVDLTSRPSREAANRLYVKAGFERRETNVYRYRLG